MNENMSKFKNAISVLTALNQLANFPQLSKGRLKTLFKKYKINLDFFEKLLETEYVNYNNVSKFVFVKDMVLKNKSKKILVFCDYLNVI